jgi:hypothetical protein
VFRSLVPGTQSRWVAGFRLCPALRLSRLRRLVFLQFVPGTQAGQATTFCFSVPVLVPGTQSTGHLIQVGGGVSFCAQGFVCARHLGWARHLDWAGYGVWLFYILCQALKLGEPRRFASLHFVPGTYTGRATTFRFLVPATQSQALNSGGWRGFDLCQALRFCARHLNWVGYGVSLLGARHLIRTRHLIRKALNP